MLILKKIVHLLFPKLSFKFKTFIGFLYQYSAFIKSTASNDYHKSKEKHESIIRQMTHGIEKAFSLPETRFNFGISNISNLIKVATMYYNQYGKDNVIEHVVDALITYQLFHKENNQEIKLNTTIEHFLQYISKHNESHEYHSSFHMVHNNDIFNITKNIDFGKFVDSRFSVRDFTNENINDNLLRDAIRIAIKSPSACNRQPWKVRIYKENIKDKILMHQNGNRGFGNKINKVILITSSNMPFSFLERNQAYIDGGMFAMSLIYSLHSLNIGSCALNSTMQVKDEKKFRKQFNIPESEVLIMFLGVGYLKDSFKVAASSRKEVDEITRFF